MSDLVIYLKTTNTCQMACEHCYNTISPFKGTMSEDTVKNVISYLQDKAKDKSLLVIFHGGEPMNCDLNIITTILDALEDNENIDFTITTNLMYSITETHLKIFKRMAKMFGKPLVSTSWDYKIRFNNNKQEELWLNNVKYLQDNDINVAPIITVTKLLIENNKASDLMNYFHSLGIDRLNFERITKTGNAEKNNYLIPLNKDVSEWLYEAYKAAKENNIEVMLFNNLKEAIVNNNKLGCRKRECQKNVITINPDGTTAGCPNCSHNIYGNITGVFNQTLFDKYLSKEEIKPNECYLCQYYEYCNGECYQLLWDESGCAGLKLIMDDILNDLQR